MEEIIKKIFEKYKIEIKNTQIKQFCDYFDFLIEENKKFNLTAITERTDVAYKHFLDSVLPIKNIKKNARVVDVGSGAGFPGVPIKILRPDIEMVLVDSLQKRVNFLNQVIEKLNLKNITAVHARVEDFAANNREKFDYALSRAVAKVATLSEYLLPLVKVHGSAIMYKSQKADEELAEGQKAIQILGGQIEKCESVEIEDDMQRTLVYIKKVKSTPKTYPRGKNLPKTKPII